MQYNINEVFVNLVAWASIFAMSWLFVLGEIGADDLLAWAFFLFFLIVALISSAKIEDRQAKYNR
jgi:hypothetical protein